MKKEILVFCLQELDRGVLSKAAEIGEKTGLPVRLVSCSAAMSEEAFRFGADFVTVSENREIPADDFQIACWLEKAVREEWNPEIILSSATVRERAVMSVLAGRLQAGLTADCTDLWCGADGRLFQIRPAYGNHLMAEIETKRGIQMATIRPGVFQAKEWNKEAGKPEKREGPENGSVVRTGFLKNMGNQILSQADIIFAGGMGIGSREGFRFLEKTAEEAGAAVGASRKAVDAGYAPYSCQIGQTGKTVHPRLYVAVGISGSVHHLAGMSGSEQVVAVNIDPKAPFFDYADYGIVGDWRQIITSLAEKIRKKV